MIVRRVRHGGGVSLRACRLRRNNLPLRHEMAVGGNGCRWQSLSWIAGFIFGSALPGANHIGGLRDTSTARTHRTGRGGAAVAV
jgi:hypothetical protein